MPENMNTETTLTEAVGQAVAKGKDWKGIAIGVTGTLLVFGAVKLGAKGAKKFISQKNWIKVPGQPAAEEEEPVKQKAATSKTK